MQWLLCVLCCVFPPQAASQPQKGSAELARAKVLEQGEHDLKGAAAVYRSVAGDAAVAAAVRAQASLLLGKLLRQLGEKAEAEAAFTAAAAGEGPAADEAKKILAGQEPEQDVLRERVGKALALLRSKPDAGIEAFGFLGRDAVPHLGAALEQEKVDRDFLKFGVRVLAELGGPEAVACLGRLWTSRDVFVRNAAREGVPGGWVRERPEFQAFFREQLKAPDAADRAAAFGVISHLLSVDELLPWLQPAGTRCQTLNALAQHLGDPGQVEKVTPALVALMDSGDQACDNNLWELLNNSRLGGSAGRSLQIKALFWSGRHGRMLQYPWPSGLGPAEHAEELVAAAQRAGEVPAHRTLGDLHQQLRAMVLNSLRSWRSPATPQVLVLARLGYGRGELTRWIAGNLADEHVPAILDAMPLLSPDLQILDELLKRPLPTAAYGPLFAWIEKLREPDDSLQRWLQLAVRVDTKEAQEYLVKRAGLRAGAYEAVGNAFLAEFVGGERRPSARQDVAMVALMRMKAEGASVAVVRSVLFKTLARSGSQGAADALPDAYRLGLAATPGWPGLDSSNQSRGLHGLASKVRPAGSNQSKEVTLHGYDTETVTRTVTRCLETGLAAPFEDLLGSLWQVPDAYPPPVLAAVCAHATACVESKDWPGLRGRFLTVLLQSRASAQDQAPFDQMILMCLQHPDTAFPREMLRGLIGQGDRVGVHALPPQVPAGEAIAEIPRLLLHQDHDVVRFAAILLGQLQRKELADHLVPLLRHSARLVRLEAITQLGALAPERILDQAAALLRDPDTHVRLAVVDLCERKLDRRAVPSLLELLKDPTASQAAAKALKAIEFYVDQTERWQRLLQNSGLQANSAAEALLKQAGKDQPKDVRLLAIASLGSLGVPETQPFLIECARESDAELAAAARAALEKIHRAAR